MVAVSPLNMITITVAGTSLLFLSLLGAIGAKVGKANVLKATIRVTFWGTFAMAVTAIIGKIIRNYCLELILKRRKTIMLKPFLV